jgi:ABC-type phosphate/phosphonate transport system substrate-binding protein
MGADWLASLPMYDFPELRGAHDVFWGALAARLISAGLPYVPRGLTYNVRHGEVWRDPSLLFAQGCEYPLATSFADHVRLVATPVYSAAGCEGARYRSAIVVRGGVMDGAADAGFAGTAHVVGDAGCARGQLGEQQAGGGAGAAAVGEPPGGFAALADLRGRRCAINELDSNSGMNLLRAAIAPLSTGGRFFGSIVVSGSHLRSVEMVASGEADVASVDCVSFAHFQRLYPSVVGELRVLAWTPSSPSLPFITARSTGDAMVRAIRSALADVFDDDGLAPVREQLLLRGVDLAPKEGFDEVLALERGAVEAGYSIIR